MAVRRNGPPTLIDAGIECEDQKSGPNWQYKLYPPSGGTPLQGSTGTSNKAQHDRLKVDLSNQARLGHQPRYIWNDAVVRYISDREGLSSLETSKTHLRWLDQHLSGVALAEIDRNRIDAIALAKRRGPKVIRTKHGIVTTDECVSAGTVTRVISVLKAVLNAASSGNGWIARR
ncbi:hypothetical protein B7759_03234 [Burkholderia glumae]|nr:hypothetical protein CG017_01034 [Burkholderia glumae]QTP34624.1 hypothetical protein B7759_03234 [Burkholderia glumae]